MPALIAHEIVHTISRTGKGKIENSARTRKNAFDGLQNLKRIVVGTMFQTATPVIVNTKLELQHSLIKT